MRMRRIVICDVPRSTTFFPHYFMNGTIFVEHKMCVLMSSTLFDRNISRSKKKCVRYDQKCILVYM